MSPGRCAYWGAGLALALSVVGACSRDSSDPARTADAVSTTLSSPPPASSLPAPPAGPPCRPSPGFEPGLSEHRLTIGGEERSYLVHVPDSPSPPMALVVTLHGAGSDMAQQLAYSGFPARADAAGFVVAGPNGIDAATRQWRFLGTPDDVDFVVAVVDDLVANACVDTDRVFATGISSGAAMSASLACQASDRFAGFGLVAAAFYLPAICEDAQPRPIVIFHGTADTVVPYEGGTVGGLPVAPAEETANAWAAHNGCAAEPTETVVGTEVVRLDWQACEEPVVMYRIVGGHTWPGAEFAVDRLGPTTVQVDATEQMWEFFAQTR